MLMTIYSELVRETTRFIEERNFNFKCFTQWNNKKSSHFVPSLPIKEKCSACVFVLIHNRHNTVHRQNASNNIL